jgi:hypothetical protein
MIPLTLPRKLVRDSALWFLYCFFTLIHVRTHGTKQRVSLLGVLAELRGFECVSVVRTSTVEPTNHGGQVEFRRSFFVPALCSLA